MGIIPIITNNVDVYVTPTTQERLAMLDSEQRQIILNSYIMNTPAEEVEKMYHIWQDVIAYAYSVIDNIQSKCTEYMHGNILITNAIYNENNELVSSEVMNDTPESVLELINGIATDFTIDYPSPYIEDVIYTIIKYSSPDGNGTFEFYKNNI